MMGKRMLLTGGVGLLGSYIGRMRRWDIMSQLIFINLKTYWD